MHGESFTPGEVRALAAYLRSLPPVPSASASLPGPVLDEGENLFRASGCIDCHVPPTYTSADTYDVGLVDESGTDRFNPPSLRGVARRSRLFHDGRYRDLGELLSDSGHPGDERFAAAEVEALRAFLEAL
jgi:hypothetical protein